MPDETVSENGHKKRLVINREGRNKLLKEILLIKNHN